MRLLINRDGVRTTEAHEIEANLKVEDLAARFFEKTIEVDVWTVEADNPLEASLTLVEVGVVEHAEITITRRTAVEVTVRFNGVEHHRRFEPQRHMRSVFDWAVGPEGFGLVKSQWPEHELAPVGSTDAVDPRLPVAAYIDRERCAHFDLRRKNAYQG
jgi:hypothetical protein